MTKTELQNRVNNAVYLRSHRLRNCTAWVEEVADSETGEVYYRLRSYNTIVACLLDTLKGRTVFVFDYWSATTCQHISKFITEYSVFRVCYLYHRSDRVVYRKSIGYPVSLLKNRKKCDYSRGDWSELLNEYCEMGW